jgi:hypothetical protein
MVPALLSLPVVAPALVPLPIVGVPASSVVGTVGPLDPFPRFGLTCVVELPGLAAPVPPEVLPGLCPAKTGSVAAMIIATITKADSRTMVTSSGAKRPIQISLAHVFLRSTLINRETPEPCLELREFYTRVIHNILRTAKKSPRPMSAHGTLSTRPAL